MSTSPKIYRPKPRRPFDYNTAPHQPPSPLLSPAQPDEPPSRTHSILNLTSSTLLGIYSPTGYQSDREDDQPRTPWGTGAETPFNSARPIVPVRRRSAGPPAQPQSTTKTALALGLRSTLLFGMGMGYGVLVRHLHDDRQLAPFQVEGIIKPTHDWRYLLFWGVAGVALGSLLPWVDTLFAEEDQLPELKSGVEEQESGDTGALGADWIPVVRSVGAFVGISFAIRKLPWASTLQASLTLALVNPVLWYLVDRSKPGLLLSSAIGFVGTALLLASNPDMMPSPASATSNFKNSTIKHTQVEGPLGNWVIGSRESIEGGIWILSVLFCSCVCFGNIGRRLALCGGLQKSTNQRR